MAKDQRQVESITNMDEDFTQWYTDVCTKAELIDYTSVKGMFIYRPYGYAIWENIQHELDRRFKETGHENVYLPVLIPESLLQGEGPCGGLCPRMRLGHYGRKRQAGRSPVRAPHIGNAVLRTL